MTFFLPLPQLLLLVFLVLVGITVVYSTILIYHWQAYGTDRARHARATALYLFGVALALGGMVTAILMTLT